MKRLTKAQLKVLDDIRRNYPVFLQRGLEYHKEKLAAASEEWEKGYHLMHIEKYEEGFITWEVKNIKTLEALQEHGDIDFSMGTDYASRKLNIGWVRLK